MGPEARMLDLMSKMYKEMQEGFAKVNKRIDDTEKEVQAGFTEVNKRIDDTEKKVQAGFTKVNKRIDDTEKEINSIKKIVINIENDHGRKLAALFDGYKQNSDKLTRIEEEVSRHEEIILRRIR